MKHHCIREDLHSFLQGVYTLIKFTHKTKEDTSVSSDKLKEAEGLQQKNNTSMFLS